MICKRCPKKESGKRKRVQKQYEAAHAAWHKRGKLPRRIRTRDAKTAENLRLARARRKQTRTQ